MATALAGTHPNTDVITITDFTSATPYPSTITVTGDANPAGTVTVSINGLDHGWPDDVDMLLVGPAAAPNDAIIMSDVCGGPYLGLPVTYTIADAALLPFPDEAVGCPDTPSDTYQPTNAETGDAFPSAPTPSGNTALSVFSLKNPNGVWSLYVLDDAEGIAGTIDGGWAINIAPPTAVGVSAVRAAQERGRVVVRWRTTQENDALGFDVFRSSAGGTVRLNPRLVRAKFGGSATGGSYSLVDRRTKPGVSYTYRVRLVKLDGSRVWAGSSSLRAR